jgi:hypothetical protein
MEKVILKECPHHGLTEYSYRSGEHRYRCKKCSVENVQKRRYKLKEKAVEYKGGKCELCGYDKCIDALEFHHKNPDEKDFGISQKGITRKWEQIKDELDKCICVCANCHREIHSKEHKELKDRIINKKNLSTNNYSIKYIENVEKIIDMKDNQGKSFYKIADELKMNRNTVMKYYHKYKK